MKVHQNQVPAEGIHLEGEDPAAVLDLQDPTVAPLGPIRWSVDVGRSGGGLFATGKLAVDLEMECVSCLRKFTYPVRVDDFAAQVELKGPEMVDLTDRRPRRYFARPSALSALRLERAKCLQRRPAGAQRKSQ